MRNAKSVKASGKAFLLCVILITMIVFLIKGPVSDSGEKGDKKTAASVLNQTWGLQLTDEDKTIYMDTCIDSWNGDGARYWVLAFADEITQQIALENRCLDETEEELIIQTMDMLEIPSEYQIKQQKKVCNIYSSKKKDGSCLLIVINNDWIKNSENEKIVYIVEVFQ